MASARDVGSWTTNLAPEKPGEPPPGWGGNKVSPLTEMGGNEKAAPPQRRGTRTLGEVPNSNVRPASKAAAGPNTAAGATAAASGDSSVSDTARRKSSLSGSHRFAVEAAADGGWRRRVVFWARHLKAWKLATIVLVRVALMTHCVVFMVWIAFASGWGSGEGLSDFSGKDIAGHPYGDLTCEDDSIKCEKCCQEADKEWHGGFDPLDLYEMRIFTIYMGMGYGTPDAYILFILLLGALLFGCYGLYLMMFKTHPRRLHKLNPDLDLRPEAEAKRSQYDTTYSKRRGSQHFVQSWAYHALSMRGKFNEVFLAALELLGGLLQFSTLGRVSATASMASTASALKMKRVAMMMLPASIRQHGRKRSPA